MIIIIKLRHFKNLDTDRQCWVLEYIINVCTLRYPHQDQVKLSWPILLAKTL